MVLVDFFGKFSLPVGSHERFMNQLVVHIFLLTLSLVNVVYLFFIEGVGKRALQKSFLQQLAFFGALMQIGSCGCSITRYNIEDEMNYAIGNAGAAFGLAGGFLRNIAIASILFHGCENRKRKWGIFSICHFCLSTTMLIIELRNFDKYGFTPFRIMDMQYAPFCSICCFYTSRALSNGTVKIDSSVISKEAAIGTFKVMSYFLITFWLIGMVTSIAIFTYINGGLTIGCVTVATYYMDKMTGLYDKPVGGEGDSLLR